MEYGGYIEMEHYKGEMLHADGYHVNCGRSCLALVLKHLNITKVYIPFLNCGSIKAMIERMGIKWEYYRIKSDFTPLFDFEMKEGEFLYIINYYGQINEYISILDKRCNLIIDYAQSFFEEPSVRNITIYTCRKFFGVADGAFLFSPFKDIPLEEYEREKVADRMRFLVGRYEENAGDFFQEYKDNNEYFDSASIKRMSLVTENILRSLDYEHIRKQRTDNMAYVDERLSGYNKLAVKRIEGAFAYPLFVDDADMIRREAICRKIYIPILWPEVLELCDTNSVEYQYSNEILPIPVDQRYSKEDMEEICNTLEEIIRG